MMHSRNRRLRAQESIRALVRETTLTPQDIVLPMFITEGTGHQEEISAMPGVFRRSLDLAIEEVQRAYDLGIRGINIYMKIEDHLKDNLGEAAWDTQGLMQRSIREIKRACPGMIVMPDVALDPYSVYGHDGIVSQGKIDNDATNESLARIAVSLAEAGADVVAPSDMMDGRVQAIREALELAHFPEVGILSYAVKYASNFYGPFRSALDSAPKATENIPRDKKTYQMDFHNLREAENEIYKDVSEGADIIMIKPGMPCLDMVARARQWTDLPIAVYQVSGEYAMLKAAAKNGWLDNDLALMESLICFKRAGADMIFTYAAIEATQILKDGYY